MSREFEYEDCDLTSDDTSDNEGDTICELPQFPRGYASFLSEDNMTTMTSQSTSSSSIQTTPMRGYQSLRGRRCMTLKMDLAVTDNDMNEDSNASTPSSQILSAFTDLGVLSRSPSIQISPRPAKKCTKVYSPGCTREDLQKRCTAYQTDSPLSSGPNTPGVCISGAMGMSSSNSGSDESLCLDESQESTTDEESISQRSNSMPGQTQQDNDALQFNQKCIPNMQTAVPSPHLIPIAPALPVVAALAPAAVVHPVPITATSCIPTMHDAETHTSRMRDRLMHFRVPIRSGSLVLRDDQVGNVDELRCLRRELRLKSGDSGAAPSCSSHSSVYSSRGIGSVSVASVGSESQTQNQNQNQNQNQAHNATTPCADGIVLAAVAPDVVYKVIKW